MDAIEADAREVWESTADSAGSGESDGVDAGLAGTDASVHWRPDGSMATSFALSIHSVEQFADSAAISAWAPITEDRYVSMLVMRTYEALQSRMPWYFFTIELHPELVSPMTNMPLEGEGRYVRLFGPSALDVQSPPAGGVPATAHGVIHFTQTGRTAGDIFCGSYDITLRTDDGSSYRLTGEFDTTLATNSVAYPAAE